MTHRHRRHVPRCAGATVIVPSMMSAHPRAAWECGTLDASDETARIADRWGCDRWDSRFGKAGRSRRLPRSTMPHPARWPSAPAPEPRWHPGRPASAPSWRRSSTCRRDARPPVAEVVERVEAEGHSRELVLLRTASGTLPIYVLRPDGPGPFRPVLALHGHGAGVRPLIGAAEGAEEQDAGGAPQHRLRPLAGGARLPGLRARRHSASAAGARRTTRRSAPWHPPAARHPSTCCCSATPWPACGFATRCAPWPTSSRTRMRAGKA